MGRTKQTARPSQPLVKKKPEDETAGFLNNMYLTGAPKPALASKRSYGKLKR